MVAINTNLSNTLSSIMNRTQRKMNALTKEMSTGKISPQDNPAGMNIATKLNANSKAFMRAAKNASDAAGMANVGIEAINQITDQLVALKELAIQAMNVPNADTTSHTALNNQATAYVNAVDQIASSTSYNGIKVLDGSTASSAFQVGISSGASDSITVTWTDVDAAALGINAIALDTVAHATTALGLIDTAINTVTGALATTSAAVSQLDSAESLAGVVSTALGSAASSITDVDYANVLADLSSKQLLFAAGSKALKFANQNNELILGLLS